MRSRRSAEPCRGDRCRAGDAPRHGPSCARWPASDVLRSKARSGKSRWLNGEQLGGPPTLRRAGRLAGGRTTHVPAQSRNVRRSADGRASGPVHLDGIVPKDSPRKAQCIPSLAPREPMRAPRVDPATSQGPASRLREVGPYPVQTSRSRARQGPSRSAMRARWRQVGSSARLPRSYLKPLVIGSSRTAHDRQQLVAENIEVAHVPSARAA